MNESTSLLSKMAAIQNHNCLNQVLLQIKKGNMNLDHDVSGF